MTLIDHTLKQAASLQNTGECESAEHLYQDILTMDACNYKALHNLGVMYKEKEDYTAAIHYFETALKHKPDNIPTLVSLGQLYYFAGDIEQAKSLLRTACGQSGNWLGWYELAHCQRYTEDNGDIATLQALIHNPDIPVEDKTPLYFSLGKIYDDLGDYANAFAAYGQGNSLKATQYGSKVQYIPHAPLLKEVMANFSPPENDFVPGIIPIFIIGLPRSGTSLLEQILSAHSQIHGCGELKHVTTLIQEMPRTQANWNYPHTMANLTPDDCQRLAGRYLELIRESHDIRISYFIDKLPANYFHVGLLHTLFPQAHFILCRRNPADVCLSNYFQHFKERHYHTFNLKELATSYQDFEAIIAIWKQYLPALKLHEIQYETLVAQPENTLQSLFAALDLTLETSCYRFTENSKKVRTASAWQVRQPLYKRSVARWKHYKPYIGTLLDELKDYMPDE